ncbi:hypothetical protein DTO96_101946 [Ephemeroptericola cinctiostellae]|uniref:Zinc finger/thioredoxin putative domain-containing protein n=1 Tax=Ephemeroptericola cinctiostellae TaxID=2268024 RepID=A0A345DCW2_9BURK|nr:MJ0042-type zinc finger domain-containing protein [Ephemeroptericola cinctiostellae]AXF86200.1 hypothetical protein DTO96_101946 [Ephemeroptericola cinctiostellae]
MNTFGTRCPACLTAFKVNADLLRLHDGYGTCGQCAHAFDMQAALFLLPPHDIHFIDVPATTDQQRPELNAIVTILDDRAETPIAKDTNTAPISRDGALKRINPVSFVPQPITDMFYRVTNNNELHAPAIFVPSTKSTKPTEPTESAHATNNISFHTEQPTTTEIPLTAPIAKVAPVVITYNAPPVSVLQGVNGGKSVHTKWINAACWVLLVGACLQTAGLFSREVSRTLPFTRAVYEQLHLPTDRG